MMGSVTTAHAGCYDLLGCSNRDDFANHFDDYLGNLQLGPNCDFLWLMRNGIYAEHGYCFKSARAVSAFGNVSCNRQNMADVPLTTIERRNVMTIARAEKIRNCPQ